MFSFSPEKNILLKEEHGINFDEIIMFIEGGYLLDVVKHPNPGKYPGQSVYVVDVSGYVYLLSFVQNGEDFFLKTLYPSRKATRLYKLGTV